MDIHDLTMPRRPLALLFDLDGTLVDSIELILTSFRHTFATHLGAVPPDSAWIAGLGTPLFTQLREFTRDDEVASAMTATYREFQMQHHDRSCAHTPVCAKRCRNFAPANILPL